MSMSCGIFVQFFKCENWVIQNDCGQVWQVMGEIITSRTPSAEITTLSAARQLVRCHDNEVTL
jgi:hypothetical protein